MFNAARIGAEATDIIPVTVVDSQQVTMGLGLLAILAAEAADAGHSMAEITALIEAGIPNTYVIGVLGTLEYLRRSGRVTWAQFGLGTLLRVKPLFMVNVGEVKIVERVRTTKRAIKRLLEVVAELGPLENLALLHTHAVDRIPDFRIQTKFLTPDGLDPLAVELTPTVGAHLGPGGLGVACIVARD
jgi:DegV family protein with EDD domain